MTKLNNFRRWLATAIWVDEPTPIQKPVRYRHKMADEYAREYDERMARHRREAMRLHGTGAVRCLN